MPPQQSLFCANSLPPLAFPIMAAKADRPLIPIAAPSHEAPSFVMCDTGLVRLRGCMSGQDKSCWIKVDTEKAAPATHHISGCPPLKPLPLWWSSLCMYEGSNSVSQWNKWGPLTVGQGGLENLPVRPTWFFVKNHLNVNLLSTRQSVYF